jgi:hypothetical protein
VSPRKILLLTFLVAILFAFIFLFERKMPTTSEAQQKNDLVWELPEDQVELVRTEHAGAVVELKKNGTGWRITKPEPYPADSTAAEDLASQLAKLRRAGGEAPAEARAEDYGLTTPTAKATLGWKDPENAARHFTRTLEFGVDIPGTDAAAARVAGTTHVLFVSARLAAAARKGPDDFKSKEVFGGSAADAARVDIDRGRGRVSLAKKNGAWWLSQPVVDLADGDFSSRFVDELLGLRALEFVSAGDSAKANLATFGLLPPLYRVTISDGNGKTSVTVEFGATRSDGNSVYARRETQVFTVPSTVAEDLSKEAVVFREPRLVRFERMAVTGLEGTFGGDKLEIAKKDSTWSSGAANVPAPSADDLMTAVLDLKSRGFLDDSTAAALKAGAPAATVVVKTTTETWTITLFPVRGDVQALVSGRPGAFQLTGDAVDKLRAAFMKAVGKK